MTTNSDIEFTPGYLHLHEDEAREKIPTCWWLQKNLEEGGIEERLKKVLGLVALMGADWLTKHPEDVNEIAYAIGCRGRDHKIISVKENGVV